TEAHGFVVGQGDRGGGGAESVRSRGAEDERGLTKARAAVEPRIGQDACRRKLRGKRAIAVVGAGGTWPRGVGRRVRVGRAEHGRATSTAPFYSPQMCQSTRRR